MDEHIVFWGDNPNVLLQNMEELFPTSDMNIEQTLNAITRLIFVIAAVMIFFAPSPTRMVVAAAGSFLFIYIYYQMTRSVAKENFETVTYPSMADLEEVFEAPTPEAPMGNIRPLDYHKDSPKKPAAPGVLPVVRQKILEQFKELWGRVYPPSAMKRIFETREGNYIFEQSLRPFYTMASTTIPNNMQEFMDRTHPTDASGRVRGHVRGTIYNMKPAAGFTVEQA